MSTTILELLAIDVSAACNWRSSCAFPLKVCRFIHQLNCLDNTSGVFLILLYRLHSGIVITHALKMCQIYDVLETRYT